MKQKIYTLLFLLVIGFVTSFAYTQTKLTIKQQDNTEQSFELASLRKLVFSGTDISVVKTDGDTNLFSMNNVFNMRFIDSNTGISNTEYDNQVILYPTLVQSSFFLKNLPATSTVLIYDVNGGVVKELNLSQFDTSVDVSSLSAGIYIVKIGDKQSFKFVKL